MLTQKLFFTYYSFHGHFIGKVTKEWRALQCVFYQILTPESALTK